jgi:dCTP deaminase
MAALSGKEITNRLITVELEKRLVIAPLLEPAEQLRDDQASIDVRLGFEFALVSPSSYGVIDEFGGITDTLTQPSLKTLYTKKYVPLGGKIVIHPHQFILASTLEYMRLPKDLMAYVIGRSTWGRLGLIVATAVGVQPGYAGSLTLELRNLGETPLSLYPGEAIAQLFFHSVDGVDLKAQALGQYSGITDILPREMSSGQTHKKIHLLKEKLRH